MKPISDYHIYTDFQIKVESKLCSVAKALIEENLFKHEINRRIDDIVFSYLNQSRTVIESYQSLYGLFIKFKKDTNLVQRNSIVTKYDVTSLAEERQIIILSYLFLISIKSQIDLMIILADLLLNNKIKNSTDFNRFLKHKNQDAFTSSLLEQLTKYLDDEPSQWLKRIIEIRNRLIHRGYNLRLVPLTQETLKMNLYDGINRISTDFVGIQTIDIGLIFDQYLTEIEGLEKVMSLAVLKKYGKMPDDLTHIISYSFSDVFNSYGSTSITSNKKPLNF